MALDVLRDYTHRRRLDLGGELPGVPVSPRQPYSGDTGSIGHVLRAGYYYNATYNDFITSSTAGTQFIHGAFNYSATSGSGRGAYLITKFSGAGAVSGECVRARSVVSAALTGAQSIHGIHAESRLASGGSCAGEACGIRATLAADASSTITSGTLSALRLDSDLAVTSTAANAAFIGVFDVNGTNKMPYFANFDASVTAAIAANTHAIDSHNLSYIIKIKTPAGTAGYIPVLAAVPA